MSRNKYLKIYIQLVRRAKTQRVLETIEKHHIFPLSIFGKNKSIVKLTPREHFIAHWLLWKGFRKRYGKSNKRTRSMAWAFGMMTRSNKKQKRKINSRQFELGRKAYKEAFTGIKRKPFSEEHRRKLSEANLGKPSPLKGKIGATKGKTYGPMTEERRRKIGLAQIGKILSPEVIKEISKRMKINNPFKGKHHSDKTKEILRKINLGKHPSAETIKKMSVSKKGNLNAKKYFN